MVGVSYRSASARPSNAQKFVFPESQKKPVESPPAPSFKDKESYQELFKPLPKPDALPPLVPFKVITLIYLLLPLSPFPPLSLYLSLT